MTHAVLVMRTSYHAWASCACGWDGTLFAGDDRMTAASVEGTEHADRAEREDDGGPDDRGLRAGPIVPSCAPT